MVTKLPKNRLNLSNGSVLAKIHMVTKHDRIAELESEQFCSSKNSYGNKTISSQHNFIIMFCSSKNSYGNKTNTF